MTAVCSPRNVEIARSLGAGRVIDYTREDFTRGGERYDLMLDVAGTHSWSECRRVLEAGGTYVGVGAAGVQHGKGGAWRALGQFLRVRVASIGADQTVVFFIAKVDRDDLTALAELLDSGQVKPVIDRTYDLAGIPDALSHLSGGHMTGKIAIEVA